MNRSTTFLRIVPVALILGAIAAFFAFGLNRYLSVDSLHAHEAALRNLVALHPLLAPLAFMALYIAIVALSLPGATIMTLAGGLVFHLWPGAGLTVVAATIGAVILYLIARFVAGDALRTRAGPFMARMAEGFDRNAFSYLLFLRLVPIFPFFAVNLVAAVIGVRLRTFVVATFFGIIPGTLAYTAIGDGLGLAVGAQKGQVTPMTWALRGGLALLALVPIAVKWLRSGARNNAVGDHSNAR